MLREFFLKCILLLLPVIMIFQVEGQNGPGGIGSTDGSSNMKIWLKADEGVFNDAGTTLAGNSDAVQEWHDQSGNGNHVTQTTASNKPTFLTGQVNNLPSLNFDGSTDYIAHSTASTWGFLSNGVDNTIITVFKTTDANPNARYGIVGTFNLFAAGGYNGVMLYYDDIASNGFYDAIRYDWGASSATVMSNPGDSLDVSTQTFELVMHTYDNTGGVPLNIEEIYVNGSMVSSINSNTSVSSTTPSAPLSLGVIPVFNTNYLKGDISEVIIYNKELNVPEQVIINNHLAARYGKTLASNDLYTGDNGGTDYDLDVIGIGRASGATHLESHGAGIRISSATTSTDYLNTDGDYLFLGHLQPNNSITTVTIAGGNSTHRWDRIWYVDKTDGGGNVDGTMDIVFDLSEGGFPNKSTSGTYYLLKLSGATWTEVASSNTTAGDQVTFSSVNTSNFTNGDFMTLGSGDINSLPVELLDFHGEKKASSHLLSWSCATEINNEKFIIQRKGTESHEFVDLGTIPGNGNSQSITNYSWTDHNPLPGNNYYRLKQIDFNGEYSYSSIINLNNEKTPQTIHIFPNPANDRINLSLKEENNNLEIFNSLGQRKIWVRFEDRGTYSIDISGLCPGVYFLRNGVNTTTFIKE